jgi:hypothetical protein
VSRSTVSRVTKSLEERVEAAQRAHRREVPYLYLDATFLDARWARTVENVSALVAYGVGQDGHRKLLGISIGSEESEASWSELLAQLIERGLSGVQLVIADAHGGLAAAARKHLPEARQQRCTVHLERNVLSKTPQLRGRMTREVSRISIRAQWTLIPPLELPFLTLKLDAGGAVAVHVALGGLVRSVRIADRGLPATRRSRRGPCSSWRRNHRAVVAGLVVGEDRRLCPSGSSGASLPLKAITSCY